MCVDADDAATRGRRINFAPAADLNADGAVNDDDLNLFMGYIAGTHTHKDAKSPLRGDLNATDASISMT